MAYSYSMGVQPLVNNIVDAIEDIVARVPATREGKADDPAAAARTLARKAAARAAALSGALALPPQLVSDISGLYGKQMELTRTHMLYCLFRHAASQLARDVAVRAGERLVIRQLSSGALRSVLSSIGISVTQRIAGTAASRWLPIVGAAAVAGYAYFDTLQVAKTAVRMLEGTVAEKEVVGA